MDKFAGLRAFCQVAESGGFAPAARVLGLSRSQVNRMVISLEDALGVSLLMRTTRRVNLTPSGHAFYERARSILAELAEAERQIQSQQDEPQGEIKVNAPLSFGITHLGPVLVDFMKRYPRIRVHLSLNDHFVDPVSDGFDITVRIAARREQPSLIDHRILTVNLALCAAPEFLRHHAAPGTPQDLAGLPCLHNGTLLSGATWTLLGPEGPTTVRINGVLCSNNGDVLREAALSGLGVVLLPTFMVGDELRSGRLVPLLPDHHAPPLQLHMIYPPNRHLSNRIRLLVKYVQERFGDQPYWDR